MSVEDLVTLDGSGSSDPDNGPAPLSFTWSQTAGPAVTLTGADTAAPTFTPTVAGSSYTFSLIVNDGQADSTPDSVTITVVTELTSLGPAKLWIGLKNSDAIGLRADLKAEVYLNETKVGEGQLNNVLTGSSGFNNAVLHTISLSLLGGPVDVPANAQLKTKVSARRTCFGGGHNSGTLRLWYNGQSVDNVTKRGPRSAGSRFDATIGNETKDYFLRENFALSTTAGSSMRFSEVGVGSKAACPARPFVAFGTWRVALP